MSAHRSSVSRRGPRTATGGRHRSSAPSRPRVLTLRAATLGTTGAAVLGLGLGLAQPLAAGAAERTRPADRSLAGLQVTAAHAVRTSHQTAAAHAVRTSHDTAAVPAALTAGVRATVTTASAARPAFAPPRVVHQGRTIPHIAFAGLGVRAVRLAATRAGDPYVYGAEGPHAFDCSGLVQWVFDHLHKDLPRTAGAQYGATEHLSHSEARVGDLIFFVSGGVIYHVAIYAGHGWIWAAPYPGKDVEKERIWTDNYLVGRVR